MHAALDFCQPASRSALISDRDQTISFIRGWLSFVLPFLRQISKRFVLGSGK
jgi:hypothetical protein